MKWFKHFSDNYRGRSINSFYREFGHTGVSWYYLLTEICAEKIEKNKNRKVDDTDCRFIFDIAFVESSLRGSIAKITRWLRHGEVLGLWKINLTKFELSVEYPILVELLDSDMRRSRRCRDSVASVSRPDKDKDKDKEVDVVIETSNKQKSEELAKEETTTKIIHCVNNNHNSVQNFNDQFSNEVISLKEKFRSRFGKRFDKHIPKILTHWGNEDNFFSWVDDVGKSYEFSKSKKEINISLNRYIEALICKEIKT